MCVALRKESVDRNLLTARCRSSKIVALRKESVDRNPFESCKCYIIQTSLSARRAWIEIMHPSAMYGRKFVALRKESVDRNVRVHRGLSVAQVALRKESVDRN